MKPPRFAIEMDATSGICAALKGCEDKRRDNYALVRPIQIPGDNTSTKMITSFADYVSTDQSSRSIFFFLNEFKENFIRKFGKNTWPPMNGTIHCNTVKYFEFLIYFFSYLAIVSDFCWAQINAILNLSGLDVVQYLNIMYDYTCKCDEELEKRVDSTIILVFLCITHLSKNFLKDLEKLAEPEEVSSLGNTLNSKNHCVHIQGIDITCREVHQIFSNFYCKFVN